MRKLLFILLLSPLFSFGQKFIFMIDASGQSAPTTRTFYLNFSRQVGFTTTEASTPPWNNTTNSFDSWTSANTVGKTNMVTSTGSASTVSATNPSALSGVGGIDFTNTADAGVFPDNVIHVIASFPNGAQYRFTGLDDTKHYKVYVHFNNHHWESRIVYFTVNSIGSTPVGTTPTGSAIPRESAGNSGEGHGSGLANTSLDFVTGVQSASGVLNITFTNTDGSGYINVSSIVLEEY